MAYSRYTTKWCRCSFGHKPSNTTPAKTTLLVIMCDSKRFPCGVAVAVCGEGLLFPKASTTPFKEYVCGTRRRARFVHLLILVWSHRWYQLMSFGNLIRLVRKTHTTVEAQLFFGGWSLEDLYISPENCFWRKTNKCYSMDILVALQYIIIYIMPSAVLLGILV